MLVHVLAVLETLCLLRRSTESRPVRETWMPQSWRGDGSRIPAQVRSVQARHSSWHEKAYRCYVYGGIRAGHPSCFHVRDSRAAGGLPGFKRHTTARQAVSLCGSCAVASFGGVHMSGFPVQPLACLACRVCTTRTRFWSSGDLRAAKRGGARVKLHAQALAPWSLLARGHRDCSVWHFFIFSCIYHELRCTVSLRQSRPSH